MNALEASDKLKELNERIEALSVAYAELWDDFDKRLYASKINGLKEELEIEWAELKDLLSNTKIKGDAE